MKAPVSVIDLLYRVVEPLTGSQFGCHVDNRLPETVVCDDAAVLDLVDAVGAWLVSPRDGMRGVALWSSTPLDQPKPANLMLEAVRPTSPGQDDGADLPHIRDAAARLDAAVTVGARHDGHEHLSFLVHAPRLMDSPTVGRAWGDAFAGRRVLMLQDMLIDAGKCERSLAAIGLHAEFTNSRDAFFDRLHQQIAANQPFDYVVLDESLLSAPATAIARDIRAIFGDTTIRIVLANTRAELTGAHASNIDAAVPESGVCPVLLRTLFDLSRGAGGKEEAHTSAAPLPEIPSFQGKRILVAEDVDTNRRILQAILAPTGADVRFVGDGVSAVEEHSRDPADLILMDIQMPRMDGVEAAKILRKTGFTTRIIALTANAQGADRERCLAAGIDDYMVKPIIIDAFYDLVTGHFADLAGGAGTARH